MVDWIHKAINLQPAHSEPHLFLKVSIEHLGRVEEAGGSLTESKRLRPNLSRWQTSWMTFAQGNDNDRLLEGLRKVSGDE